MFFLKCAILGKTRKIRLILLNREIGLFLKNLFLELLGPKEKIL